jgi:hypothetical protein
MAKVKHVFLVCEGALWLVNILKDRFVGALTELDFYHATEHLWTKTNTRYLWLNYASTHCFSRIS